MEDRRRSWRAWTLLRARIGALGIARGSAMSRGPIKWNLTIYQGATFRVHRIWRVGDTRDAALPVDLAGCTARMHVRPELESETILLTLTTENGGIQLGDVPGRVQLFLSDEQTAPLTWESGVYDLEVEFTDGDVRRLFAGSVKVSPEVTRG